MNSICLHIRETLFTHEQKEMAQAMMNETDKMKYQKIESTLYEFIGFNDGETHAYYRRKGNQRVEKAPKVKLQGR